MNIPGLWPITKAQLNRLPDPIWGDQYKELVIFAKWRCRMNGDYEGARYWRMYQLKHFG